MGSESVAPTVYSLMYLETAGELVDVETMAASPAGGASEMTGPRESDVGYRGGCQEHHEGEHEDDLLPPLGTGHSGSSAPEVYYRLSQIAPISGATGSGGLYLHVVAVILPRPTVSIALTATR